MVGGPSARLPARGRSPRRVAPEARGEGAPPAGVRPLHIVMAVVWIIAGLAGYALGGAGVIYILEPLACKMPDDRHALFLGAFWSISPRMRRD